MSATPRSSRSTPPAPPRAARRSTSRSSRARTPGARRRARTGSWRPESRASSWRSSTPTRAWRGAGVAALRDAGVTVDVGCGQDEVAADLAAYLHHRSTGRPYVVLKWAATLDGRTAAPDAIVAVDHVGGRAPRRAPAARRQRRGARGRGHGARGRPRADRPPRRRRAPAPARGARRRAPQRQGAPLPRVRRASSARCSTTSARAGVLQLLVEGGAHVAHDFVDQRLVDRIVAYVAPALLGGDDGAPGAVAGPARRRSTAALRGRFVSVATVGEDLRVEVEL